MHSAVEKPIFFVGAPRSGTTVIFNIFAARSDLAWFSQHLSRFPRWPSVTAIVRVADLDRRFRKSIDRSDRRRGRLEKLRIGPSEAYGVWEHYCGKDFVFGFMRDAQATQAQADALRGLIASLLRYQGKSRFATKITGPARIAYLSSIFPDARFIHIVRDGRAVVNSLLNVHFWRGTWREHEVSWRDALTEAELEFWRESGESPLVLAALQWRAIIVGAREEAARIAPGRYEEVRYEDFVARPKIVLARATRFCELPEAPEALEFLERRVDVRDMNYRWRERFHADEQATLDAVIGDTLAELGYPR